MNVGKLKSLMLLRLLIATLILSSCYPARRYVEPVPVQSDKLAVSRDDTVAIITPKDGGFSGHIYAGSGNVVAQKTLEYLRRSIDESNIRLYRSEDEYTRSKENFLVKYVIKPEILHWEDRATNWSGLPDVVKIDLYLVDAASSKNVNIIKFVATSSWWTFVNRAPDLMLDTSYEKSILKLLQP